MNLKITGHHVDVTEAMREYITTKLERVFRHFDHVTSATVIVSVDKLVQKAEVTVAVRGKDIHVESSDQDLYAAIDSMVDKIDRQVIKHKQKMQEHGNVSLKHQETEQ